MAAFRWGHNATNLWERNALNSNPGVPKMTFSDEVNGFSEFKYNYKLTNIYSRNLYDEYGEVIEIGCTVLEFRIE